MESDRTPTIVAVTSEPPGAADPAKSPPSGDAKDPVLEDRHAAVRRRAAELARRDGATVVLFDLSADMGPFESPLPTAWSGEGEAEQFGDRLTPNDLTAAGRQALADQVDDLRQAGVDAYGWLPSDADGSALLRYAIEQGAELVLISAADTELLDQLNQADRPTGLHVETVPAA
jgi:hypothetical protein